MLLDGVLAHRQLFHDLLGGISPQYEGHDVGLGAGDAVAVQDQGCDLAGAGFVDDQYGGSIVGAVQPRRVNRKPVPPVVRSRTLGVRGCYLCRRCLHSPFARPQEGDPSKGADLAIPADARRR
jgi:hypothetical protein